MTKQQLINILTKFATVPNQSKTKFFIPADKISEIAGEVMKLQKAKKTPPDLETCYIWFPDFPKELVQQAWQHYEDGKNENGEWTDSQGKIVINHKQKMRTNWLKPEHKTKPETPISKMVF